MEAISWAIYLVDWVLVWGDYIETIAMEWMIYLAILYLDHGMVALLRQLTLWEQWQYEEHDYRTDHAQYDSHDATKLGPVHNRVYRLSCYELVCQIRHQIHCKNWYDAQEVSFAERNGAHKPEI